MPCYSWRPCHFLPLQAMLPRMREAQRDAAQLCLRFDPETRNQTTPPTNAISTNSNTTMPPILRHYAIAILRPYTPAFAITPATFRLRLASCRCHAIFATLSPPLIRFSLRRQLPLAPLRAIIEFRHADFIDITPLATAGHFRHCVYATADSRHV